MKSGEIGKRDVMRGRGGSEKKTEEWKTKEKVKGGSGKQATRGEGRKGRRKRE